MVPGRRSRPLFGWMETGAVRRAGSAVRQPGAPQRTGGAAQGRGIASQIRQVGLGQQRHDSPAAGTRSTPDAWPQAPKRKGGAAGMKGWADDGRPGAVDPLPGARYHRRSSMNCCYTYASQYPFWGNAMPGAVARASRALAVGNAEQAASRSKAAGRWGEPLPVSTRSEQQTQLKRLILDSSTFIARFCDEENLSGGQSMLAARQNRGKAGTGSNISARNP